MTDLDKPKIRLLNNWATKYAKPRPRRLLAFDGGGIRGIIALQIAQKIEDQLREKAGGGKDFRLGDYFDYIGGTSTGAIIATGLALGMKVEDLIDFYCKRSQLMFKKASLWKQQWYKFRDEQLCMILKEIIGERTLGATDLHSLLLIVTRNASTDSPWPLSNNPYAKYNARDLRDCNLDFPLWQLVRASTAAPTYFPPEKLILKSGMPFYFIDGGISPYHNPAYLLFRMATSPQYRLSWPVSEQHMMLISVGTGSAPRAKKFGPDGQHLVSHASYLPLVLMESASIDQDIICRTVGRCVYGDIVDSEIGDMRPRRGDPLSGDVIPLDENCGRQFLYARYNPRIDAEGLKDLGLEELDPAKVAQMDGVKHLDDMLKIGHVYAEKYVEMSPFARFS